MDKKYGRKKDGGEQMKKRKLLDKELRRFLIRELRCFNKYKWNAKNDNTRVYGEYLRHIAQTVEAVDTALECLNEEQKRVVELMFLRQGRYTADGVAMQAGYHRATVYRISTAFLEDIARRLGYIE